MTIERITNGSRQVVIATNDNEGKVGPFWSRLYVNNGETATLLHKSAQTLKGARKQAAKMLEGA
jgi:hypothetical protein